MRKRALKINPYQTAWIGRVDTIPPQSDERTALIDRGLILRGLLTSAQIADIHRVGDQWLRHHEAVRMAEIAAKASADAAIAERRAERAALKEEKRRAAAERAAARAADVAKRRAEDIIFLGRGVSARLGDRRAHVEELGRRGLPLLSTPADVAKALGLGVPRLRWLAYHAEAPTRPHYVYFEVPKRAGGTRLLAAPHEDLKRAQRWILDNVLAKLPLTDAAHGFAPERSVVSNAREHVGRDVVVNCDLKDFFPTITFARVRGVFEAIGYSPAVATILALLCTEAPRSRVEMQGRSYYVAVGPRALPQGAPTSPALSNQVGRKLDQRLRGLADKLGWRYTRYADDLTFSAPPGHRERIPWLLARVRHIAQDEGFALNPKKTRVQRAARRQEVTGVVVNAKPSLPREELRRLRAILHRARTTGLAAQNREGHADFEAWLRGKIAYVAMIDRQKGERLLAELEALGWESFGDR
jgi:retron-type reverse transcriptase